MAVDEHSPAWLLPLALLKRQALGALLIALAVLTVVELAQRANWFDAADAWYGDAWHRLAGKRFEAEHVALVRVDQESLNAHGDEPLAFWGPHFARVILRLRELGVAAVGMDFLLAISPDAWLARMEADCPGTMSRVYDAELRAQIAEGNVVLVGSTVRDAVSGKQRYLLPHMDYLLAVPDFDLDRHLGLADVATDTDGIVRHFMSRIPPVPDPLYADLSLPSWTLPALLARQWRETHGQTTPEAMDTTRRVITYAGPPGSIASVSMRRLEADDYARDPVLQSLKGKVVILGAHFAGMGDVHFTPYSTGFGLDRGQLMSGAEVQANSVETLLSGRETRALPTWARIAGNGLFVLVCALVVPLLPLGAGLGVAAGLLALMPVVSYQAFQHYWLWPTASGQAALLLAMLAGLALKFSGEARQRSHMARVFRRYVSDAAVKVLMRSDKMPEMGGELHQITVLFSDIRNFTSISEMLQPAEVVEMLNVYFDRVCEPILKEGGSIDKFIGDAVMAEFGAPLPTEDHALRALRAAVGMQRVAAEFRGWMVSRFPDRGLPEFAIGVGVHSGAAIIGSIGSSKRSEYTAIGDTVNVASRLEGVTKELHAAIVASQATVTAAGPAVQVGRGTVLAVKGHKQPIEVFEILDVKG